MTNVRLFVSVLAAATAVVLALVGCTSEDPSEVGDSLATTQVDTVLAPLRVETLLRHGQQLVNDDNPDRSYVLQDVLYLGEQEGMASAILVNFDFSDPALVQNDSISPGMLTEENITAPKLRLNMLWFYKTLPRPDGAGTDLGLRKFYEVFRLLEPFDTDAQWPGPVPPHDGIRLNANTIPDIGETWIIEIELRKPDFISWVQAGDTVGFLIQEGTGPPVLIDPGIVGFSSRDNRFPASTIGDPLEPVTVRYPGPILRTKFVVEDVDWNIDSQADVSTFHQVAPPPASPEENIVLRTHLRSYPALHFDLSRVPPNALINRADLVFFVDTERSYGNAQNLVVSEYDSVYFGGAVHDIRLAQLDAAIDYMVTGMTSRDPKATASGMKFNVTGLVQRQVNRVEDADPGMVITAGESFPAISTKYWTAMGPGYWLTEYRLFGLAATDSLRPRLEISYSVLEELGGGGDD